jgi:hypothetical protein
MDGGGSAGRLPATRRRWSGSEATRWRGASMATRSVACECPWASGHTSPEARRRLQAAVALQRRSDPGMRRGRCDARWQRC